MGTGIRGAWVEWCTWLWARFTGCVRCSLEMEFGPREFIGLICVGDFGIGWWVLKKTEDAAVCGGLIVWKVLEEKRFEGK